MDDSEFHDFCVKVCNKMNKHCKYHCHAEYDLEDFECSGFLLFNVYIKGCDSNSCKDYFKKYKVKFRNLQFEKTLLNIVERLNDIEENISTLK